MPNHDSDEDGQNDMDEDRPSFPVGHRQQPKHPGHNWWNRRGGKKKEDGRVVDGSTFQTSFGEADGVGFGDGKGNQPQNQKSLTLKLPNGQYNDSLH